jgi:tetraacyldisaccharide 4'-kinase
MRAMLSAPECTSGLRQDRALMRAPAFWWRANGGRLLAPLSRIYGAIAAMRLRSAGQKVGVPVVCVGNLTVGGAGKTPAALSVGRLLLAENKRPFFLTRGYGGRLAGPVRVDRASHGAADVGDEPLLLAEVAPTVVARDRVAGAIAAQHDGADVIVMDDGFQNPSLAKDLAILAVDGGRTIGNGRVFPAGPLRAPLEIQLARAHALLVVGAPNESAARLLQVARQHGAAIFHGSLEPDRTDLDALDGRRVMAFAGIADPEKFYATLREAGVAVAERASFPDHHRYTAADARALIERADAAGLTLITTEKDHARLTGDAALAGLATRSSVLRVQLRVSEEPEFRRLILSAAERR